MPERFFFCPRSRRLLTSTRTSTRKARGSRFNAAEYFFSITSHAAAIIAAFLSGGANRVVILHTKCVVSNTYSAGVGVDALAVVG